MNTKSIKHIAGLPWAVAPLFIVAALIASTHLVKANKPPSVPTFYSTGTATLAAVGDESNASGTANLTDVVTVIIVASGGTGQLAVSGQGLTPGASYRVTTSCNVQNSEGIATAKGILKISASYGYGGKVGGLMPSTISVYRVGSSANVLVLSGVITWQQKK